jgi:hypothetical protein
MWSMELQKRLKEIHQHRKWKKVIKIIRKIKSRNSCKSAMSIRALRKQFSNVRNRPNISRNDHITKLCRSVLFTLRRLWTTASFTPTETGEKLVFSLIIPKFLYCEVFLSKTTAGIREKLKVAFNSCARYIFGMSRRQHISEHVKKLLGVALDVFYSFKICHTMYKLIKSGSSGYLRGRLRFDRSRRKLNLTL